jgi:hypothetical protein
MVGRRTADQVLTPRVRALVLGALAVAVMGGVVMLRIFKTSGFSPVGGGQAGPVVAASAPASPEPDAPPVDTFDESPSTLDSTRALRAAERGRNMLAQGRVKAAVALLADASRILPNNAELAHAYGAALWRFAARDRALFQFRRALKLSPDNDLYREDLGRALHALGRTAEAAHVLQAPALADAALAAARGATGQGEALTPGLPPVSLDEGAKLGGAGTGSFKGRRSFTDADLRGGGVPAPSPTDEPGR